jgi:hypothetical protein
VLRAGRQRNLDSNLDRGKTYFSSPKRPPRLRVPRRMGNNGTLFGDKAAVAGRLCSSCAEVKNESGAVPPVSPYAFMTCTETWLRPIPFY